MSSWPPTLVDWGVLTPKLRDGDPVCLVHGLVDADTADIGIPIARTATRRSRSRTTARAPCTTSPIPHRRAARPPNATGSSATE